MKNYAHFLRNSWFLKLKRNWKNCIPHWAEQLYWREFRLLSFTSYLLVSFHTFQFSFFSLKKNATRLLPNYSDSDFTKRLFVSVSICVSFDLYHYSYITPCTVSRAILSCLPSFSSYSFYLVLSVLNFFPFFRYFHRLVLI